MLCFIWQDKESRAQPHGYVLLRQGGEGASRPTCATYASGQSTMHKASQLDYNFLAYFTYIQQAGAD